MQLNLAIFQFNQRTGFLLKPEVMRHEDRNFDPFTSSSIDNIVPATLSIQIISGQFLTDKRVGTFVEVRILYGWVQGKTHIKKVVFLVVGPLRV